MGWSHGIEEEVVLEKEVLRSEKGYLMAKGA